MSIPREITISQTIQLKQYEPLTVSMTFEIELSDDPVKECHKAARFVYNTLRSEYYRQRMLDTNGGSNGLSDTDREKYQKFIDRHLAYDYFNDTQEEN